MTDISFLLSDYVGHYLALGRVTNSVHKVAAILFCSFERLTNFHTLFSCPEEVLVLLFGTREWRKSFKKNPFPTNIQIFAIPCLERCL